MAVWSTEKIVEKRIYTISGLAKTLDCSRSMLYDWIKKGLLKLDGRRTCTGKAAIKAIKKWDQVAYQRKESS